MSFFRKAARSPSNDDGSSISDDESEAPPDDDSEAPPPSDDDSPPDSDEDESMPPDSDEDDDLPDDMSEGPPEDDMSEAPTSSVPPDSDEDEESLPPPDDDSVGPEDAKRPSRRISRHEKSESFDLTADEIGIDSPSTKRGSKAVPPPPNAAPPPPRMSERLSQMNKRSSGQNATPSFVSDKVKGDSSEITDLEEDLASLSFGLQVKEPIKLDHSKNKAGNKSPTQGSAKATSQYAHRASLLAAFNDLEAADPVSEVASSKKKEVVKPVPDPVAVPSTNVPKEEEVKKVPFSSKDLHNFIMMLGCYEGDAYETLGLRVVDYGLQIYIKGADEIVEMSLQNVSVDGYQNDELSFTFIENGNIKVFFKCHKKEERKAFFQSLPEGLISFPSDLEKQKRLYSIVSGKKIVTQGRPSQIGFAPPPLSEHPDATGSNLSVKELADLLNIDGDLINAGSYVRKEQENVHGHSRAELTETHIKKAHVCIRRAKQICKWLNSLHLQDEEITVQNYDKEFASGVYLAKLIRHLIPGSEFPLLNERALSRGAAIKNIELSLQIIWRSNSVNSFRIASSAEIFEGNKLKIMIMLQEIFDVYVRRPLYAQAVKMFKWFNQILKQYSRRLPIEVFTEADFSDVWKTFQSGTALFCIIYHLHGPTMIGEGQHIVRIDPMRVVNRPTNIIEYKSNVVYTFSLLRALNIEICWDPMDWITYPDVDFVLVQLQYLYDAVKTKHCVLPPAMGSVAGVASSVAGEPLVVGMIFSDTITVSIPTTTAGKPVGETSRTKRVVGMVGAYEDNVTLLPIDSTGKSGRFASSMCPFGLLSGNMKVVEAPMTMKGARVAKKTSWNPTSDNNPEQERMRGSKYVEKLKEKNQVTPSTKSDKLLQAFSHHRVAGGVEDRNMDRPTEVVVHEYTKEGYKASTMKLNPDGTVPTEPMPSLSVEIVATAIEKLEKDMSEAEGDIEMAENELSSQYLELEANAHKMGAREYDKQLALLEKRRLSLEDERSNLHESFALRMESIKLQHAEAVARADGVDAKKEAPKSPSDRAAGFKKRDAPLLATVSSPTSGFKKSLASSPSKSSMKSSSMRDNSSVASTKIVQREWISASHSSKSHNVVLKKKAELAERSINDQHMHPKAKARESAKEASTDSGRSSKVKIDHKKMTEMEAQEMTHSDAWDSFLHNLNARTVAWGTDAAKIRKKPNVKSKELGTNGSVKPHQDNLDKAVHTTDVASMGNSMQGVSKTSLVAATIRKDELKAMNAEDKRRQAWMRQQRLNDVQSNVERRLNMNDLNATLNSPRKGNVDVDKKMSEMIKANESRLFSKKEIETASDNEPAKDASGTDGHVAPRFDPSTFAPKDVETAFKWLQASRQFLLVDRISKTQYYFQLIKDGSGGKEGPNYIFTWKDLVHSQTFEGSIPLKFCKNIMLFPKDPSIFVITIDKSPTALKQSGGRSSVAVQCTSEVECGKYFASLDLLMKTKDQVGNQNYDNTNNGGAVAVKNQ